MTTVPTVTPWRVTAPLGPTASWCRRKGERWAGRDGHGWPVRPASGGWHWLPPPPLSSLECPGHLLAHPPCFRLPLLLFPVPAAAALLEVLCLLQGGGFPVPTPRGPCRGQGPSEPHIPPSSGAIPTPAPRLCQPPVARIPGSPWPGGSAAYKGSQQPTGRKELCPPGASHLPGRKDWRQESAEYGPAWNTEGQRRPYSSPQEFVLKCVTGKAFCDQILLRKQFLLCRASRAFEASCLHNETTWEGIQCFPKGSFDHRTFYFPGR